MARAPRPGRTPLAARFLIYYAIAYVVLIGLTGYFIMRNLETTLTDSLTSRLEVDARLAAESLPEDPSLYPGWADRMFDASGLRFTLIDIDGVVVADSHSDPALMENHADRPEVAAASSGEVGRASRVSASTGFEQHYLALPREDGLIVRASVSEADVQEQLSATRSVVVVVSLIVGLIGIAIVAVIAGRIAAPITELTEQTRALAAGATDVEIERSSIRELHQLGIAISQMAGDMGERVAEAENASETLSVVLGALPQGAVLVGPDDEILYANTSAVDLLGSVPENLGALVPYSFQTAVRECRDIGGPVARLAEHGRPVRRLHGVATPFADADQVLLVAIDVTDQERAAEVRRDFVANASHELKTPITSIVASADALRIAVERDIDSAPVFAAQIRKSALQLDRLVSDLLDLSRLERDEPVLEPLSLDLLVREEAERVRVEAERAGVELHVEVTEVPISGSRGDLAIAVRNLLENAVHYTSEGGTIVVNLGVSGGEAVLEIRDTGVGIPTRDLDRIFERFYRVDDARSRSTGGTGLGLSIVKHVAESHGGQVEVDSELGVGSVFTVTLPVDQGETQQ